MEEIEALMTPAVSIILPVLNRRHLVMRAIASVENQTTAHWELLIIDDGSSDGLEDLITPELDLHPRWRYLKHSNRKLAASRNIGIHAALAPLVTFLDADDEYLPAHLELRLGFMQANPGVDLIHGGVVLKGPEETHWVEDAYHPGQLIHLSQCTIGATLFGYKRVFLAAGGFKLLPYSAESELMERLQKVHRIERVDFPTYLYYTGLPDSICTLRKQK